MAAWWCRNWTGRMGLGSNKAVVHMGMVAIGGGMVVAVVYVSPLTCVFTHMCLHLVVPPPLVVVLVAGMPLSWTGVVAGVGC